MIKPSFGRSSVMSSTLWTLALLLLLGLPQILVCAAASSSSLSRRLLSNESTLASPPSTTPPSTNACSTVSTCNSRILPHSRTLTISVVCIFVSCVIMAFVSVYARRFCIAEGSLHASYQTMERSGEYRGNEALVQSLPVVKYGAQEDEGKAKMMKECAVCLSEFESGEVLRLLPACEHLFHKDCIDMWLFSHTTCPLCRLSLLKNKKGSLSSGTSSHRLP